MSRRLKGKESLIFVQDLVSFIEDGGLVYVSYQAARNWLEKGDGPGAILAYDSFLGLFSPGPS